jgi:hypothetical protein
MMQFYEQFHSFSLKSSGAVERNESEPHRRAMPGPSDSTKRREMKHLFFSSNNNRYGNPEPDHSRSESMALIDGPKTFLPFNESAILAL